jgi:hypothetical protein
MSNLGGLLEGGIIGLAVSEAASTVVEPALEPSRQEANSKVKARIHELPELAQAVAQALLSLEDVQEDAGRNGYPDDGLALQVQLALRAPGVAEALAIYRRNKLNGADLALSQAQLHHAYAKAQVEYQWWPYLDSLARAVLDLPSLANAIQRGIIAAPFPLPYDATPGEGRIASFPTSNLDAEAEAAASGYTVDQLFIATAEAGNPPGPEALYRAMFRGDIDQVDVERGLVEGRARGEWAPAFESVSREIPSPVNFVEGRVRNWITDQQMYDGTARHGMSPDDTNLLFLVHGRPISFHQVFIGLLRGGEYDGPTDQIPPASLKQMQESDIRPEWYNLLWAGRFSFPPLFQLNNLVKGGAVDPDTAAQWATWEGEAPEVVTALHSYWETVYPAAGGGAAAPSPLLTSQRTAAVTAIRKVYLQGERTPDLITQDLQSLGYGPGDIAKTITIWDTILTAQTAPAPGTAGPT